MAFSCHLNLTSRPPAKEVKLPRRGPGGCQAPQVTGVAGRGVGVRSRGAKGQERGVDQQDNQILPWERKQTLESPLHHLPGP